MFTATLSKLSEKKKQTQTGLADYVDIYFLILLVGLLGLQLSLETRSKKQSPNCRKTQDKSLPFRPVLVLSPDGKLWRSSHQHTPGQSGK